MSFGVAVHVCRFPEWTPSTIQTIAAQADGEKVAVGREDGDIEILLPAERYRVQRHIAGHAGKGLQSLVWAGGLQADAATSAASAEARLFGCTLDGTVFEADLYKLCYKNVRASYGGSAWCMARAHTRPTLAVGCEDGSVKLFTFQDGGLEYSKSFPSTDSRILSVAWSRNDSVIYASGLDSHIRCFDSRTGQGQFHMRVEQDGATPAVVWCLAPLGDNTLASGDSRGSVQVWDGATGTLLQNFKTHQGDVLCLAVTSDLRTIFASGADSKTTALEWVDPPGGAPDSKEGKWALKASHRPHTHDVRTLACCKDPDDPTSEILLSGGVDTRLYSYKTTEFQKQHPRRLLVSPPGQVVFLAREARLLMVAHLQHLTLYRLPGNGGLNPKAITEGADGEVLQTDQDAAPLQELVLRPKGEGHIACAALSPDGSLAALSTPSGTKAFRLVPAAGGRPGLTAQKVHLPEPCAPPAHRLCFTPESSQLILAAADGLIKVVQLPSVAGTDVAARKAQLLHSFPHHQESSDDGPGSFPVVSMNVSADGQWLASGGAGGDVHVFNLDTLRYHWTLPKFATRPVALAFHCVSPTLAVVCADGTFHLVDVEERQSTEWSRDVAAAFPKGLQDPKLGPPLGIAFNPAKPSTMLVYWHSAFCYVDLDQSVPGSVKRNPPLQSGHHASKQVLGDMEEAAVWEDHRGRGHKRKWQGQQAAQEERQDDSSNFTVCHKYKALLLMDFAGPDELVAVENPASKLMTKLPDTLFRAKYGT